MFTGYSRKENEENGRSISFGNRKIQDIEDAFNSLIMSKENFRMIVRDMALTGILGETKLRSLCWKIFLNVFPHNTPIEEYSNILTRKREEYTHMKEIYIPNATKMDEDDDILLSNPLSTSDNNPWYKFYSAQELSEEIRQDLNRLYPMGCGNHFEQHHIRDMMFNVLFLWSRMNADTSYRQGMHELLGVLIYVLESEQIIDNSIEANSIIGEILDCKYLEHDLFWLFYHLMEDLKPLFYIEKPKPKPSKNDKAILQPFEKPTSDVEYPVHDPVSPFLLSCVKINQLLNQVDPVLHNHLQSLEIEPQLYCLRWLRLIFQREFHIEDCIIIWDWLFAENQKFKLGENGSNIVKSMEYISVALLEYMRDYLLVSDAPGCLHRLMHFPPIEDIECVLITVKELMDGNFSTRSKKEVIVPESPVEKYISPAQSPVKPLLEWTQVPLFSSAFSNHSDKVELEKLQKLNAQLGKYLNSYVRIVEKGLLSKSLLDKSNDQPTGNELNVIGHAVAGVKLVADVLVGDIRFEDCEWNNIQSERRGSRSSCDHSTKNRF